MTIQSQYKLVLASYARSILAAELALYLSGNTNTADYAKALVAAVAPVIIRWLNKNDVAFGRGATPEQVADLVVDTAIKVAKKAPAKKAAPAKVATKAPTKTTPAKKTAQTTTKGKTTK